MSIYTIVLFLHVSGAIGYFVSIGIWLFGLVSLRRAQRVEQVRALVHLVGLSGPLFGISVLLILAAGLYMAFTAWSLQTGWIAVALVSLVLMAPLGTALIEPRRRAIERLARETPDGPPPQSLEQRIHDPVLLTALQTVAALLFAIVFLMTTRPSLAGFLVVIVVALALGLAWGLLVSRVPRHRWQNAAAQAHRAREPVDSGNAVP